MSPDDDAEEFEDNEMSDDDNEGPSTSTKVMRIG